MEQLKFLIVLISRLGNFSSHNMSSAERNCEREGDKEALWSEKARVTLAGGWELEGWSGILCKTCSVLTDDCFL